MKITVIAVGKVKEKYFREAVLEYEKRLSKYCRFTLIEVEDEKTPDKAGGAQAGRALEEKVKKIEAERIARHIREDAYVITLEIRGRRQSSEAFAEKIRKLAVYGQSHIQFIIGGSLGLHSSIAERADDAISFSDMTFPHQLMRVILVEQIYRGYRIINGEPYHK